MKLDFFNTIIILFSLSVSVSASLVLSSVTDLSTYLLKDYIFWYSYYSNLIFFIIFASSFSHLCISIFNFFLLVMKYQWSGWLIFLFAFQYYQLSKQYINLKLISNPFLSFWCTFSRLLHKIFAMPNFQYWDTIVSKSFHTKLIEMEITL